MTNLRTVGIKELKNNLSAYIRDVRRGTRILVSDRNTIVAELREPLTDSGLPRLGINPLVSEWVSSGVVSFPTAEKTSIPASPVNLKEGVSLELLDQVRGESHE